MGSYTNIGIYIGEGDKDIAAWFNLLQRNGQSRSKWVCGLLAAYALKKQLQIGIVDCRAPLIRDGPLAGDTVSQEGPFQYGWHVRGPNREYVIGSVISLSLHNDEIKDVLDEAWANGHKRASFIKALIRNNLRTGDKDIPPRPEVLHRIWAEYLVAVNSKMTNTKKSKAIDSEPTPERPKRPPIRKPAPNPKSEQPDSAPSQEVQNSSQNQDRAFHFQEDSPPEASQEPSQKPRLGRNPLLSQI